MSFRQIFPLNDSEFDVFKNCSSLEDFLIKCVDIYFENKSNSNSDESRICESSLAVYWAFRDHYPEYLSLFKEDQLSELDEGIEKSSSRLIKLRRMAINGIAEYKNKKAA